MVFVIVMRNIKAVYGVQKCSNHKQESKLDHLFPLIVSEVSKVVRDRFGPHSSVALGTFCGRSNGWSTGTT